MRERRHPSNGLVYCCSSWLSSKTSTEAMNRGGPNENAVVCALCRLPFVTDVFDVGMMSPLPSMLT